MSKYNILVVEDDKNIQEVIGAYLLKEGFNTYTAYDGQVGLDLCKNENIHLAIIDLMLPFKSGEDLIKELRTFSNIPIIILTAKADENNRITGFTIGADDYITKPFSPKEMTLRVKALIKRVYGQDAHYKLDGIEIDFDNLSLYKDDELIDITTNEFKLLKVLIDNKNQVLSREQLINLAFGSQYEAYNRTIDTHIKNLRRKLEDDHKNPKYIKTIYGIGYIFKEK